jgi:CRISPR/Cas system CMR-associated protein Cmr5 small subunit
MNWKKILKSMFADERAKKRNEEIANELQDTGPVYGSAEEGDFQRYRAELKEMFENSGPLRIDQVESARELVGVSLYVRIEALSKDGTEYINIENLNKYDSFSTLQEAIKKGEEHLKRYFKESKTIRFVVAGEDYKTQKMKDLYLSMDKNMPSTFNEERLQ